MSVKLGSPPYRKPHRLRMSEERVLTRTYGPTRDEETEWSKSTHNGELHNLHFSPNIIMAINSSRMRYVGYTAHVGNP
jgi:hypothetical protein